jgi:ribonuclease P protein component
VSDLRSGQRLGQAERLKNRFDYLRCYRKGRRHNGSLLALHSISNSLSHPRLGITASRKVGKAVVRQRVKRRVREVFRRWPPRRELGGVDLIVHLQPSAGKASFAELSTELDRLLRRQLGTSARRVL